MRFTNPYSFMAEKKTVVDFAYPGDVVGLYDRGELKIGDTLSEGEELEFVAFGVLTGDLPRDDQRRPDAQ